jgi:hypothetical protein
MRKYLLSEAEAAESNTKLVDPFQKKKAKNVSTCLLPFMLVGAL